MLYVVLLVIQRVVQFVKMVKDRDVDNIHTSGVYFSAFIIPYGYYRVIQSSTDIELYSWSICIALFLLRAQAAAYYISKQREDWSILVLSLLLTVSCLPAYAVSSEDFYTISIWVTALSFMYSYYVEILQYMKIKRNKSSVGISSAYYIMACGLWIYEILYAIYYSNIVIIPLSIGGLVISLLTYMECKKHKVEL